MRKFFVPLLIAGFMLPAFAAPRSIEDFDPIKMTSEEFEITCSTAQYTANDAVDGIHVGTMKGTITGVIVTDKHSQEPTFEIFIFTTAYVPTADADEMDISDADNENCIGVITVDTWKTGKSNSVAHLTGLNIPLAYSGTAYYWQMRTTDTPDPDTTSDYHVKFIGIEGP